MTDDPRPRDGADPDPLSARELEPLLEAAFERGGSVLESLAPRLGERGRVLLRDADADGEAPVIDPRTAATAGLPQGRGNYQLMGEIARGGMGVVMKGHDADLGRDVALKVLHEDLAQDPTILARFVEEAQIGGQLQHPGIVPVYELGLMADERPFFTMKLVKGRTLSELLAERERPGQDLHRYLSIFQDVCQTMAYAHSRGVIHRDLKPSNVMVGAFGEVQVVDWGLAKVLRRGGSSSAPPSQRPAEASVIETVRSGSDSGVSSDSVAGSVMGTPAYMSPEQAEGEALDARTDVFAMGAILCEVLTGKPPYPGPKRYAIEQAAAAKLEDAHARLADSGADRVLVGLVRACLAPDPDERPRDAGKVLERLTSYLASTEERAQRARLRAARTVGLSISAVVAFVLGAAGWWRVEDQRMRATTASVNDALMTASQRIGEENFQAALVANEQAVALIAGGDFPRLVERAELQRERIRHAARVRGFVDELADLRIEHPLQKDEAYPVAFASLDLDLQSDPEAFAQAVRELETEDLDLDLESAVALALHDWILALRLILEEQRIPPLARLAAAVDPDETRNRLREAFAGTDRGRFMTLVQELGEASSPPPTALVMALGLQRFGAPEQSAQVFEDAIRRHPDDFQLRINRSLQLLNGARGVDADPAAGAQAWRHLEAARALVPERGRLMFLLARAQYCAGDPVEAAASCRRAIVLGDGDLAMTHELLSCALDAAGRTREALAALETGIARFPGDAGLHNTLAWVLSSCAEPELRDPERALEEARTAWDMQRDPSIANTLGLAYCRMGMYFDCLEPIQEALAGDLYHEFTAESQLMLAMAHHGLEEEAEAREWVERAERELAAHPPVSVLRAAQLERLRAEARELLGLDD